VKVSKRQLKRIIREEKRKLQEQGDKALKQYQAGWNAGEDRDVHGDDSPYATPGTAGYGQAMDDLEMELINALSRAMEEGLIVDDLNDAWARAMGYIEDMLESRG
jgi:hypothetical protein